MQYWCTPLLVAAAAAAAAAAVIIFSGNVLAQPNEEHEILKKQVLVKGMVLQTFSIYMQQVMLQKQISNVGEELVTGWKMQPPRNLEEMISAVYERYNAMRLMINFLACRHFYQQGAAKPEVGDYKGCMEYSRYLNYYNGLFTAVDFYESYVQSLPDMSEDVDAAVPASLLQIRHVAETVDKLFQMQRMMYATFEMAREQDNKYADLFQLLRHRVPALGAEYGEPIERLAGANVGTVEDAFRRETLIRLHQFYGPMLLEVENYWIEFFSNEMQEARIQDYQDLVKDGPVEEERQRMHHKVMEESDFEPTNLTLQNVDAVHYAEVLFQGTEMRVNDVPETLPEREWTAEPAPDDANLKLMFQFSPATLREISAAAAAAAGAGASSFGAGPSSSRGADTVRM